jgi:RimJ/RimL family protein N-acetyltransferase
MHELIIRELKLSDEVHFLSAMQRSQSLYDPWMKAPLTHDEFVEFYNRYNQSNHKSFLLLNESNEMLGIFNLSEIVRGIFQNAYLGFSVVSDFAEKGYMSRGLKLILEKIFTEMELHRLEANIQPTNLRSINLVKKNGFRMEGFSEKYLKINGEWRDFERWAITYEDWLELK